MAVILEGLSRGNTGSSFVASPTNEAFGKGAPSPELPYGVIVAVLDESVGTYNTFGPNPWFGDLESLENARGDAFDALGVYPTLHMIHDITEGYSPVTPGNEQTYIPAWIGYTETSDVSVDVLKATIDNFADTTFHPFPTFMQFWSDENVSYVDSPYHDNIRTALAEYPGGQPEGWKALTIINVDLFERWLTWLTIGIERWVEFELARRR